MAKMNISREARVAPLSELAAVVGGTRLDQMSAKDQENTY